MRWKSIALALIVGAAHAAPSTGPRDALAAYVTKPDATFSWKVHAHYSLPGADVVELILHSQTWHGILWKHQLYLIKPTNLPDGIHQGLLAIGGGHWEDSYATDTKEDLPGDAQLFVRMARSAGTVVAVVDQVPFQPLFHRREDDLIAYTFERYLRTGDPTWPLLLPMVKSAVKAMDAAQQFAKQQWGMSLQRFTVLGGSKRGWTTWLTGAVDQRAAALAPVVIDALNFKAHMPYQTKVWGAPSAALEPFTKLNLLKVLGSSTKQGRALREIVDPYSYRKRYTQPKLIVIGTNDHYFPLDSLNLYWKQLPRPKYVLYLPNNRHNIKDFRRLVPAVAALHRASAGGKPMPKLAWEYREEAGVLRLCLRADPSPSRVLAWTAHSSDSDFREATFSSQAVAPHQGVFVFDLPNPASGYSAVFAEGYFGRGDARFPLSTNVRLANSSGDPPSKATAIRGQRGICPGR
jgi:PhoPQ-activated pathogenicity-related protein